MYKKIKLFFGFVLTAAYQIESGKLVKNETHREAVETIFRLYMQGKIGYTGVTKYLNKNGFKREPAPNAVNPQFDDWNVHHVKRILTNPIYTGRIAWGRRKNEKVEGTENEYKLVPQDEFIISDIVAHEPYISREEFEKIQEMMKIAAKRGNHNIGQTQAHLLSGIAKCPECGSSMYVSNSTWTNKDGTKGNSYRYICSHHLKSIGSKACRPNGISTERLDREVLEYTKRLLANKEFAKDLEEKVGHVMNMEEVDKEIDFNTELLKKAERRRSNLERDIDNIDGDDKFAERKRDDYNRRLNKIYEEIYKLEDAVQELEGRRAGIESKQLNVDVIYELLKKFDKIYDKMDKKERREWVKSMIYEVGTYTRKEINQHGYAVKYITYKFPIDSDVLVELRNKESHVETCVLLSRKIDTPMIEIDMKVELDDITEKPTYKRIKEYVKENFGLNVHTKYIAEVKRKHGLEMHVAPNKVESPKREYPNCPKEKFEAIEKALTHFGLL